MTGLLAGIIYTWQTGARSIDPSNVCQATRKFALSYDRALQGPNASTLAIEIGWKRGVVLVEQFLIWDLLKGSSGYRLTLRLLSPLVRILHWACFD